jgi:hypothetical protein
VADGDRFPAHEDLFHQQSQDLLSLGHVQRVCPRPQPGAKIGKRLDQPQIPGLIAFDRFQRLQFGLEGLVLLAKLRHSAAQLLQTHQTFLIGNQQPVHALRQPSTIPPQLLLPLLQRIGIPGRLQAPVQLLLNDPGILQQPHDFGPDDGIELVLTNGRVFADCSLEVTICIGTNTAVVVEPACGGLRGGAIEPVAATLTNQHPL